MNLLAHLNGLCANCKDFLGGGGGEGGWLVMCITVILTNSYLQLQQ